jgi:hypothetical protein
MSEKFLPKEASSYSEAEVAYLVGRHFSLLRDGLQALLVTKRCLGRDFVLVNSNFDEEFDTIDNLCKDPEFYSKNSKRDLEWVHQMVLWLVRQMIYVLSLCNKKISFFQGYVAQLQPSEPMDLD